MDSESINKNEVDDIIIKNSSISDLNKIKSEE